LSRLNINKPADFAALTASAVGSVLNAFNKDTTEWNIEEASYTAGTKKSKPVKFHIFESISDYQAALSRVVDRGGRRVADLDFPYVDGKSTDDLGKKGEEFQLEVIFHGLAYRNGLIALMKALNDPVPGELIHPVRGPVRCKMRDYELVHSHEMTNAVQLNLQMTTHDFDAAGFGVEVITVKTKLQKAIEALAKVGAVIAAVRQAVAIISGLRASIIAKIQEFQAAITGFIVDANAIFNDGVSIDIQGALPVQQGGLVQVRSASNAGSTAQTAGVGGTSVLAGGYVRVGSRFTTVVTAQDPLANIPVELLGDQAKKAISVLRMTKQMDVLRQQLNEIISDMSAAAAGQGCLVLHDQIMQLKQLAISAQEVLEQGIRSSNSRIINYTVPHIMSIREAAFHNGLPVDEAGQILLMNPQLQSTNYIAKDTVLLVPVST
jgi:hypothetical protein